MAAARGEPVVIPRINESADGERDVWLLDSAVLVRNNTYLELQNGHLKSTDQSRDNIIRSIRGYSAGGHHLVRLLNASGLQIHDVLLDGLIDTSTGRAAKAAVKIGDSNPVWGGVTPLGDTYRIAINNVISRASTLR